MSSGKFIEFRNRMGIPATPSTTTALLAIGTSVAAGPVPVADSIAEAHSIQRNRAPVTSKNDQRASGDSDMWCATKGLTIPTRSSARIRRTTSQARLGFTESMDSLSGRCSVAG
jgi:hypothetical protein